MLCLDTVESIYKTSPIACVVLHPNVPHFTIAYANEAFLRTTAVNSSIVGKGIFEAFPENAHGVGSKRRKAIQLSLEQALYLKEANKIKFQQYNLPGKNAEEPDVRFWNCDTYPLLDEDEKVKFIVQSPSDITDMVISRDDYEAFDKEALNKKNFEHPLFNDYPDAIFTLDIYGNFLSANNAFIGFAECTREELLKLSFIPFIATQDFEKVFNNFQKALKGEIQQYDAHVITAKGTPLIVNFTKVPVLFKNEVISIYVIAKNITSRIKMKQKLALQREQLDAYNTKISNILDSITDSFFAVDSNWIVTYWNKQAEWMLGMLGEDIIGKNLWELYPDAVGLKFYTEYYKAMSGNISVRFDEYYPPLDIWIEVSAYPSADGLSVYFKDITERKNADEKLNREKERYLNLFNYSPLPQWVYDVETLRFLDVNKAAIQHYGYSLEEFLSMTVREIVDKDEVKVLEALITSRARAGLFTRSVLKHRKKSGELLYADVEGNSISFDGKMARLALVVDITERRKAEQALEASEQRFKSLVQDGSDLIGILDAAGNYKYVSPTTYTILGIEAEYFIGKSAFDFIHEDDREMVAAKFALLTGQNRIKLPPFRFKNGNEQFLWIETIITDMTDDPAVGGIVANSRDITQRIENEIRTFESVARFNIVSKATSDAIYDWDLLTNEVVWNKGINAIFGYSQPLCFTREWWFNQVHPGDEQRLASKAELHIKKARWKDEYRFRCADGSYKHVLDRGFVLFNDNKEPIRMIGALQDITERVNYTKAIEEQNSRLREIAWMQSHVVRAPLSRIMGLSMLLCDSEGDESTRIELLKHLNTSAEELDGIVRNIVKKTEGL